MDYKRCSKCNHVKQVHEGGPCYAYANTKPYTRLCNCKGFKE